MWLKQLRPSESDKDKINKSKTKASQYEQTNWIGFMVALLMTALALLSLVDLCFSLSLDGRIVNTGSDQQLVDDGQQVGLMDEAKQVVRLKREAKKNKKGNKQLEIECLAAHNKFRRQHQVPDLIWDNKLAAFAQKRSNHIAESDGAAFGHPPGLPFGENLFWHSSTETPCDYMVRGWYDEIKLYNYRRPTFASETGHFTQVVWRDTKRVGCALANSSGKRGGSYLTCSYDPAGNFLGEFPENVLRPFLTTNSSVSSVTKAPVLPAATTITPITTTIATTNTSIVVATTKPNVADETTTKPKKKKKKNKNKKKKNKNKKKKNKNKKKKNDSLNAGNSTISVSTNQPPTVTNSSQPPIQLG